MSLLFTSNGRESLKSKSIAIIGGRGAFSSYGGVESASRAYAHEFGSRGYKTYLFGDSSNNTCQVGVYESVACPRFFNQVAGHFGTVFYAFIFLLFTRKVKTVFLFASGPCVFTFAFRMAGFRVMTSLRAVDSERDKWGLLSRLVLRFGEYSAYTFSHIFTVNSKEMYDRYKPFRSDVIFIPNGINLELVNDVYVNKYGRYILFAARFDPVKRLHVLLEAFNKIKTPDIKLVIAGGNSKDIVYERELKKYESERIVFLGHVNQKKVNELMVNCSLFVLPSILEGMSNSLLLAMSMKRKCLVADVRCNTEVLPFKQRHFQADNSADLACKIDLLLSEESQLEDEIHDFCVQNYSWKASVDKLQGALEECR